MPRRVLAILVGTAALALASCGGGGEATSPSSAADAPGGSAPRDGLLGFDAQAIDGSTVDVASFSGEDLAIWFWAPW